MSKLNIVNAARAATLSAVMFGVSAVPAFAADAVAPDSAGAATEAPADPDTAAAPAEAAPDAAAPAEAVPDAAPADAKPAEPAAKPMKAPAAAPVAPEKSAAAPQTQPAPAQAAVAAPVSGSLTIGASVVGADGKEVGKVNRVSGGPSGAITEIHVNTSGAAGLSGAIVAIPGDKISSGGDKVKLSLTSDEVSKLPKLDGGNG